MLSLHVHYQSKKQEIIMPPHYNSTPTIIFKEKTLSPPWSCWENHSSCPHSLWWKKECFVPSARVAKTPCVLCEWPHLGLPEDLRHVSNVWTPLNPHCVFISLLIAVVFNCSSRVGSKGNWIHMFPIICTELIKWLFFKSRLLSRKNPQVPLHTPFYAFQHLGNRKQTPPLTWLWLPPLPKPCNDQSFSPFHGSRTRRTLLEGLPKVVSTEVTE